MVDESKQLLKTSASQTCEAGKQSRQSLIVLLHHQMG